MSSGASGTTLRRRLAGLAFLAVFALLAWLSVALYHKQFTPVALVTLYTGSAGNEMHAGAQVMVRGVQVGSVRRITADGQGARLELALQPGALPDLPANVSAEMLPTTLFGERYVDLVLPASPVPARLAAGSVITQDHAADAIELERVLGNLLPMLTSMEPARLSLTLTALAQGLAGRGAELGQALVTLNSYLGRLNPKLPALDTDISELAKLARTYQQAAPDIISALSNLSAVSQTLARQRASLSAMFTTLTTASDDLRAFLDANSANLIRLSADSTSTLATLARYSPEFPCTLRDLVAFEPAMNKVLGKGTRQPGLHVNLVVVPSPGRYLPGRDTPVYGDNLGPHCYPVPFPGITLHDGASPPAAGGTRSPGSASPAAGRSASLSAATTGGRGSGARAGSANGASTTGQPGALGPAGVLAGSPAESELVRELAGMALGRPPASLPGWSDLLIGPLLRGARVIVR